MLDNWTQRILTLTAAAALGVLSANGVATTDAESEVEVYPQVIVGEALPEAAKSQGMIETAAQARARVAAEPPLPDKKGQQKAGEWATPSRNSTYFAHSGTHYIANKFGDLEMAIGFPRTATIHSVFIAGQGAEGVWPEQVRAVGYQDGVRVGATEWKADLGERPQQWMINLTGIDRLVFEALPGKHTAAWYAIDDLSFTMVDAAGQPVQQTLDFDSLGFRHTLTGTDYAGLVWEKGGNRFKDDGDAVHPPQVAEDAVEESTVRGTQPAGSAPLLGGTLPVLQDTFQGTIRGDAGSFSFPPDTHMAAGPNHIVEVTNRQFVVINKTSGQQLQVNGLGFLLPGTSGDPRVLYDQYTNRWVAMATDFSDELQLSVSLTDDPTGAWFKTEFNVSQGTDTGRWPDHPTLGVDEHGIYMAAFMVGGGMSIFAVDKAPLVDASPSLGTVTAFRNLPFEGAIHPVHTYGFAQGAFFVSRTSGTTLRLRRLNGPLTAPQLVDLGSVSVIAHNSAPDSPALGSSSPLDSVDTRLWNAVYRDGSVWTTHHVDMNNRAAVRWYEIDTQSLIVLQTGTISDPSLSFTFPSLAVDNNNNMAIGFSGSDAQSYSSAFYAGRAANDPPNVTSEPMLYRAGAASQNNFDNFGRNRWGDYSQTAVDPDGFTIWTAQTYGHSTNIWGTSIARLTVQPPPAGNLCLTAPTIGEGANAFTTINATTDGTDTPCGAMSKDVWFRFVPQCEGEFEISITDADFTGTLAIYSFVCPSEENDPEPLACTDGSGPDGLTLRMPLDFGLYRVRIGSPTGEEGSGIVNLTCLGVAPPCPWDCSPEGGNGEVNIDDLLAIIDAFSTQNSECDVSPDNGDGTFGNGVVNVDDLLAVVSHFGPCPTP